MGQPAITLRLERAHQIRDALQGLPAELERLRARQRWAEGTDFTGTVERAAVEAEREDLQTRITLLCEEARLLAAELEVLAAVMRGTSETKPQF